MSGGAFQFKNESDKKPARAQPPARGLAIPSQASQEAAPPQQGPAPSKSDALAAMAAIAAHAPVRHKPKHDPKSAKEKGEFVPGKKPTPRSGQTVHEMMRDHEVLTHLHHHVRDWESKNPGKKLKGPDVHKMMGGRVSHGQSTRLAQKIHQKHQEFLQSKVANYIGRGGKKTLGA